MLVCSHGITQETKKCPNEERRKKREKGRKRKRVLKIFLNNVALLFS